MLTFHLMLFPLACFAFEQKGFDTVKTAKQTPAVPSQETAELIARNLFGVCANLQNPKLYQPIWSDAATVNNGMLVASKRINRGDIISLYPVHSLGLRGDKTKKKGRRHKKKRTSDYLVFDADQDGHFFGSTKRSFTAEYCLDFPALVPELKGQALFLDANPHRELVPGWMGHLCKLSKEKEDTNCAAIPLLAVPLCAVVATQDIQEGDSFVRDRASAGDEKVSEAVRLAMKNFESIIAELQSFTNMAYPSKQQQQQEVYDNARDEEKFGKKIPIEELSFKKINMVYPGIQKFHSDPDIYCVEGFLTDDECDRVIAKCKPHMMPCVTKDSKTGVVEPDTRRTSTNSNLPQVEAPLIVSKLVELLDCRPDQLEILQVLRYEKGQEFKAHTDGFDGPVSACGFQNSGRLVTVFTYLNDVKQGGHTSFPELNFSIAPKKGCAVVHFPATESLEEDIRTVHQGMRAVDEKWLLATWAWQHDRTDELYAEKFLPHLNDDIII